MISESPSFLAGTMPSCFGNLELLGMCYTWLLKLLALVPQAIVMASRGMVRLITSWVEETCKGSVQKWSLPWICSNFSLSDLQKKCPKACYVDISYHPLRVYCFPFSAKSTGLLRILQRTLSIFTGAVKRYRLFHGRHDVGLAAISLDHGVQSKQQLSKFCTEWIALPGVEMGGSGLYKGYFTYWSAWRSIR